MEENNDLQYDKSKEYAKINEDRRKKIEENCLHLLTFKTGYRHT
jgi:hypothetical protein